MTISTTHRGNRPGRLAAGFMLLCVIGGMTTCPLLADDHGHRGGHDRGHDRGHWRHGYDRHDWRGRPEYEPYQVYAPPPVYYPPQPSSGVSLFFPIHIR